MLTLAECIAQWTGPEVAFVCALSALAGAVLGVVAVILLLAASDRRPDAQDTHQLFDRTRPE